MNWSPSSILVSLIAVPLIGVWLYLAYLIVSSAITDIKVRDEIEGILMALAILTTPVMMLINEIIKQWRNETSGGGG